MYKTYSFADLVLKTKKLRGIKTDAYKILGKFPVIDQGNKFIAGYTDSNESLYEDALPVVIFGDHTLSVKYIDFPFCAGADGTQILKPNPDIVTAKFLYYAIQNLHIKSLGYSRHFKILKEATFKVPSLDDQNRIVEILDKADSLRKKRRESIELMDEYIKLVFIEMFGDPVSNPNNLEQKSLGELTKISSGSTPNRNHNEYYGGDISWVKTTEVNGSTIMETQEKITDLGLRNSSCHLYPAGSIIVAMYGQGKTRGQVGVLGIEATTNQACGVMPPSPSYNTEFMYRQLSYKYDDLRSLGRGGNQPNLNVGILKNYRVLYPAIEEQEKFSAIVKGSEAVKRKMLAQASDIENQFQSLMQGAFYGTL